MRHAVAVLYRLRHAPPALSRVGVQKPPGNRAPRSCHDAGFVCSFQGVPKQMSSDDPIAPPCVSSVSTSVVTSAAADRACCYRAWVGSSGRGAFRPEISSGRARGQYRLVEELRGVHHPRCRRREAPKSLGRSPGWVPEGVASRTWPPIPHESRTIAGPRSTVHRNHTARLAGDLRVRPAFAVRRELGGRSDGGLGAQAQEELPDSPSRSSGRAPSTKETEPSSPANKETGR